MNGGTTIKKYISNNNTKKTNTPSHVLFWAEELWHSSHHSQLQVVWVISEKINAAICSFPSTSQPSVLLPVNQTSTLLNHHCLPLLVSHRNQFLIFCWVLSVLSANNLFCHPHLLTTHHFWCRWSFDLPPSLNGVPPPPLRFKLVLLKRIFSNLFILD